MPFLPIVRVPRLRGRRSQAALQAEHGYRHTAIIHSRNVEQRDEHGPGHEHDALRAQRALRPPRSALGGARLPELLHRDAHRRGRHHAPHLHARAADRHAAARCGSSDVPRPRIDGTLTSTCKHATLEGCRFLVGAAARGRRPPERRAGRAHRPPRRARGARPCSSRRTATRCAGAPGEHRSRRGSPSSASWTRSCRGRAGDEARHRARARGPPHGGARSSLGHPARDRRAGHRGEPRRRQRPGRGQGAGRGRPPRPRRSGQMVAFVEGREAANPYWPGKAPVDAYCALLVDAIDFQPPRRERPSEDSR